MSLLYKVEVETLMRGAKLCNSWVVLDSSSIGAFLIVLGIALHSNVIVYSRIQKYVFFLKCSSKKKKRKGNKHTNNNKKKKTQCNVSVKN